MEFHEYANLFPMMSDQEHAALVEDMRENGFRAEFPIWLYQGKILDGRNRFRAAQEARVEPVFGDYAGNQPLQFVIGANLNRRHLNESQRAAVAEELANLPHGVRSDRSANLHFLIEPISLEDAADLLNVSRRTAATARTVKRAAPELMPKIKSGEMTLNAAMKEIQKKSEEREREKARAALSDLILDGGMLLHGDFRTLGTRVVDGSCTLVFTDPPYDRKSLPLFESLGEFASRVLVEGGSLITFCGQYVMDEVIQSLSKNLRYFWVCCCLHTGNTAAMREYGIKVKWKPMLWFVKGNFRFDRETWIDDLVVSQQEKTHHPWQQSVLEAKHYIESLTSEGDLVCDPFCGGGTTAFAAKELGRKFWTCDIDPRHVNAAKERLQ